MAVKSFTQGDKATGGSKPKKQKGSELGSQTFSAGKAGGMRYGATEGSSQPRGERTNTGMTVQQVRDATGAGSTYTTRSPGLGYGGAPNTYGTPTGSVSSPSYASPGLGTGGDVMAGGGMSTRATNVDQATPMTGAGAQYGYTPQGLGMLYDNPNMLANDVLSAMGINANPGMAAMLGDAFTPALYAYTMLNPNLAGQEDAAVIDYIANYMDQMTTPGGSMPSYEQLMSALMGVGSQDSDLGRYFATLTPQEQTEFIAQYARAAGYGLNPLMQRVLPGAMDYTAQQYLTGVAKGNPDGSSYADYFRRNGMTGF